MKHTPGPWKVNQRKWADSASVYGADGYKVADVDVIFCHKDGGCIHDEDTTDRPMEEFEANACLIAAAPDLLAELEHAHDMIKHYLKAGYLPHMSAEEAEQLVRNPDSAIVRAREGR